jgi:alpha-L-arabinofuranosidase
MNKRKTGLYRIILERIGAVSIPYEAYPDCVFVDEYSWANGMPRLTDRVLANANISENHLKELISEEVGF